MSGGETVLVRYSKGGIGEQRIGVVQLTLMAFVEKSEPQGGSL